MAFKVSFEARKTRKRKRILKDEKQIIEALRSGVQLSTLDEFMNIDDIAILRPIFTEEKSEKEKDLLKLQKFPKY